MAAVIRWTSVLSGSGCQMADGRWTQLLRGRPKIGQKRCKRRIRLPRMGRPPEPWHWERRPNPVQLDSARLLDAAT